MQCFGGVGCGTMNNPFDFGGDPDHDPTSGFFFNNSSHILHLHLHLMCSCLIYVLSCSYFLYFIYGGLFIL